MPDAEVVATLLDRPDFQRGPAADPSQLERVTAVVLEPVAARLRVRVARRTSWETIGRNKERHEHVAL